MSAPLSTEQALARVLGAWLEWGDLDGPTRAVGVLREVGYVLAGAGLITVTPAVPTREGKALLEAHAAPGARAAAPPESPPTIAPAMSSHTIEEITRALAELNAERRAALEGWLPPEPAPDPVAASLARVEGQLERLVAVAEKAPQGSTCEAGREAPRDGGAEQHSFDIYTGRYASGVTVTSSLVNVLARWPDLVAIDRGMGSDAERVWTLEPRDTAESTLGARLLAAWSASGMPLGQFLACAVHYAGHVVFREVRDVPDAELVAMAEWYVGYVASRGSTARGGS